VRGAWPCVPKDEREKGADGSQEPAPSRPLGVNPYIYAENNPVMMKDMTGLQPAGYYRGGMMGQAVSWIGTWRPPQWMMYDCCAEGYTSLTSEQMLTSPIHYSHTGAYRPLGWDVPGELCKIDPKAAQPNPRCAQIVSATPDLICSFLEICEGAKCPPWRSPSCPTGMTPINVGFESDPRASHLPMSKRDELEEIEQLIAGLWATKWIEMIGYCGDDWYGVKLLAMTHSSTSWAPSAWWWVTGQFETSDRYGRICVNYQESIYQTLGQDWAHWRIEKATFPILPWHSWIRIVPKDGVGPYYTVDPWLQGWTRYGIFLPPELVPHEPIFGFPWEF